MDESEKLIIEKGVIIAPRRKVQTIGVTNLVSLPREWVKIQKWLGREVSEVCLVANSAIVILPVGQVEKAKRILQKIEEELKNEP
jgi:hypothetical protein